jgi:hypothetical protein
MLFFHGIFVGGNAGFFAFHFSNSTNLLLVSILSLKKKKGHASQDFTLCFILFFFVFSLEDFQQICVERLMDV